jgi:hypothetical protein
MQVFGTPDLNEAKALLDELVRVSGMAPPCTRPE